MTGQKSAACRYALYNLLPVAAVFLGLVILSSRVAIAQNDVSLTADSSYITWPSDHPRDSEYKSVVLAPESPGGNLMLYLPLTRPSNGQLDTLYLWSGTTFADQTATALPFLNPAPDRGTYDADFVDVDDDGDYDIVHTSPHGNLLYINNGGVFADETMRLPSFVRIDNTEVWDDSFAGDADGDGDIDLLFANRTHDFNGGNSPGIDDPRMWGPSALVYNDGAGFFNRAPLNFELFGADSTTIAGESESSSHAVKFADLNNDGRLDLLISHSRNYSSVESGGSEVRPPILEIFENGGDVDGNGLVDWLPRTPYDGLGSNTYIANFAMFDFNRDRNLDLYLAVVDWTGVSQTDRVILGDGNFGFSGSVFVPALPAGMDGTSYDAVIGDINHDDFLDIAVPEPDGGQWRANALYLNNGGTALTRSDNDAVLNPVGAGSSQVAVAFGDVDRDGDLDMVWGNDSRSTSNVLGDPKIVRNNMPSPADPNPPRIDTPRLFLSATGNPAAVFRVRISDRLVDIDEIDADLQWDTVGSNGNVASSSAVPLKWASALTYQARLDCRALTQGFDAGESITALNWSVTARDFPVPTQQSATLASTDSRPDIVDLVPALGDSSKTGLSFNILSPTESSIELIRGDGTGRMLVRMSYKPLNFVPDIDAFSVTLGTANAAVVTGERVGNEYWLVVDVPAGAGVQDLAVTYRLCNAAITKTQPNAVVLGDPRFADTVLVVDTSGSMEDDRKMESAVNAASLYLDTLHDDDRVGAVRYSGTSASDVQGLDVASIARGPTDTQIGLLTPAGCTPLGQGLLRGLTNLDSGAAMSNRLRSIILLSDGKQNVPRYWGTHSGVACNSAVPDTGVSVHNEFVVVNSDSDDNNDVRIHTLSLGPDSDPGLMGQIAALTGGNPLIVDLDPSPENATSMLENVGSFVTRTAHAQAPVTLSELVLPYRLANAYEHFHNAVSGQNRLKQFVYDNTGKVKIVKLPDNPLLRETRAEIVPVPIEPGLSYATLSLNWATTIDDPIYLIPPPGQNASAIQSSRGNTNFVFRIDSPVAGVWQLLMPPRNELRTVITLSGASIAHGFFNAVPGINGVEIEDQTLSVPRTPKPGEAITVALALVSQRAISNATVTGLATSNAHGAEVFALLDDGQGGDRRAGDGIYTGQISRTNKGGMIHAEATAQWTGDDGVARSRVFPLGLYVEEVDSDGDRVTDVIEDAHGFDPDDPQDVFKDPDRDGLLSWKELAIGTDPFKRDTDDGGVDDGTEFFSGTDALDPADDDKATEDTDGDGMPDPWELGWGLDPNDAADANQDIDGDGVSNVDEFAAGTSPKDRDTDGDGVSDADEIANGTDPTDGENRAPPSAPDAGGQPTDNVMFWICLILILLLLIGIVVLWIRNRVLRAQVSP